MRLRNIPGSREVIAESPFVIQEPEKCKGNWNIVFQNDHPVHIEVEMCIRDSVYHLRHLESGVALQIDNRAVDTVYDTGFFLTHGRVLLRR